MKSSLKRHLSKRRSHQVPTRQRRQPRRKLKILMKKKMRRRTHLMMKIKRRGLMKKMTKIKGLVKRRRIKKRRKKKRMRKKRIRKVRSHHLFLRLSSTQYTLKYKESKSRFLTSKK
jgi:hypothetical protein